MTRFGEEGNVTSGLHSFIHHKRLYWATTLCPTPFQVLRTPQGTGRTEPRPQGPYFWGRRQTQQVKESLYNVPSQAEMGQGAGKWVGRWSAEASQGGHRKVYYSAAWLRWLRGRSISHVGGSRSWETQQQTPGLIQVRDDGRLAVRWEREILWGDSESDSSTDSKQKWLESMWFL